MKSIKFDTLVFCDGHQQTIFDDHSQIYCALRIELFDVSSKLGSLEIHCPGCGKMLSREAEKKLEKWGDNFGIKQ